MPSSVPTLDHASSQSPLLGLFEFIGWASLTSRWFTFLAGGGVDLASPMLVHGGETLSSFSFSSIVARLHLLTSH